MPQRSATTIRDALANPSDDIRQLQSEAPDAVRNALATLHEMLPHVPPSVAEDAAMQLTKLAQLAFAVKAAAPPAPSPAPAAKNIPTPVEDITDANGEDEDDTPAEPGRNPKTQKKRAAQKAKKLAAKAAANAPTPILTLPEGSRGVVRVFEGTRGRGLQCIRRVEKGEELIGIPASWALSTDSVSISGGTTGQRALALELIRLRRLNDFRVTQLPKYNDMPCFWSAEELEYLKPSYVYDGACNQKGTLVSMHSQLSEAALKEIQGDSNEPVTADDFVWAMAMVQSRTFGGNTNNGHPLMVLLPYIDLVNSEVADDLDFDIRRSGGAEEVKKGSKKGNSPNKKKDVVVEEKGERYISVHATRAFDEGEEALVSYHGKAPPSLYSNFLAYGYVAAMCTYPPLFPWDAKGSETEELQALLEKWEEHAKALEEAPLLKEEDGDMRDDTARRKAIAKALIRHEATMSEGEAAALKKALASRV